MPATPAPGTDYDLLIIGSGAGSIIAALVAKSLGKSAAILEKQPRIGGSTSMSGGVVYIPNHPLQAPAGVQDSYSLSRTYLDHAVTHKGPAVTGERKEAFLKAGPRMISFLQKLGMQFRRPKVEWPDYYDDLPGGLKAGRCLMAAAFDLRELGNWQDRLTTYEPTASLPIGADEFATLFLLKRTMAGKLKAAKLAWLMFKDKATGSRTVANGMALQGRLLQIALREGINIYSECSVRDFLIENGRVIGVLADHGGKSISIRARDAVLVDAGGFSRSEALRQKYCRAPITKDGTSANRGDTGEMLQAMIALGAATDCLDAAWWVSTSRSTDGRWPKGAIWPDGQIFPFAHALDLSLPHVILVNQDGRRFVNESGPYAEVVERSYEQQATAGRAIPAWAIFDKRHRERYPWGNQPPGVNPKEWIETGYMKKADTLSELAEMCDVDPVGLSVEVERYNAACASGHDPDFNRGDRSYDRSHGDPTIKPNPNLGAIAQGPFYACALYPSDVGTSGGVVTDQYARVKRDDGSVIPGLYAVGSASASVFGRTTPGAGASIGPIMTFAYIAAHHSAGSTDIAGILG